MDNFFQPDISGNNYFLDQEESGHCIRVLRYRRGDAISVLDGQGTVYTCEITIADPKKTGFRVVDTKKYPKPGYSIHIAVAPTKNIDRIEWFIEKSVETGIDAITFISCDNSERTVINPDRITRKIISALKQSGQLYMPAFKGLIDLKDFIKEIDNFPQKFICHVSGGDQKHLIKTAEAGRDYVLLVGPEGDFSDEELNIITNKGFEMVLLGKSRLRTETAAFTACCMLHALNELTH